MKNGLYEASEIRAATLTQAKDMIQHNLTNSDRWLIRGLLAIFDRQTSDEQAAESTKHHNQRGFGGCDAEILTSFAKQALRWEKTPQDQRRFDRPLSPKQLQIARKKMMKYAGQLARVVREARKAEEPKTAGQIAQATVAEIEEPTPPVFDPTGFGVKMLGYRTY